MTATAKSERANVAVVHLVRVANETASYERFLRSYAQFPAEAEHELVLLMKGFADEDAIQRHVELARPHSPLVLRVSDEGFDLMAYGTAIRDLNHSELCFLNSHSEILVQGWLRLLLAPLRDPEIALVGATGSWESRRYNPDDPWERIAHRAWPRKLKWHWNRLRRGWNYPPFPNPHIRTNAFAARRPDLGQIWQKRLVSKQASWKFESGKRGLTRRFQQAGRRCVVVGANGKIFEPNHWSESQTFRCSQNNLLVADNQTRSFATADPATQTRLANLAWQDPAKAESRKVSSTSNVEKSGRRL